MPRDYLQRYAPGSINTQVSRRLLLSSIICDTHTWAQIRKDTEEATHNVVSRASSSFGSFFSLKNKHSEAAAAVEETASETNRDKDKKAKDKKPAESASARFKSDAVDQVTKLLSDGGSLLSGGGKESPEAQRRGKPPTLPSPLRDF